MEGSRPLHITLEELRSTWSPGGWRASLGGPSSLREEKEEEELPPSLSEPLSSVATTSVSWRQRSAVLRELRLSQTMKDTGSRL